MTATRRLRGLVSRAVGRLRRLTGQSTEVDYRRWYSTWDLERDYWTIVGPATKEEYEELGAVKLRLLINLGLTPDVRILDVGCGTGLLTAALHEYLRDGGAYCGTDISPDALAFCRSRFRRPNFSFHQNAMTTLPPLADASASSSFTACSRTPIRARRRCCCARRIGCWPRVDLSSRTCSPLRWWIATPATAPPSRSIPIISCGCSTAAACALRWFRSFPDPN